MSAAEEEILAKLASEGVSGIDNFLLKHLGQSNIPKATRNVLGLIMDAFVPSESRLVRPTLPNTSPSALRNELSAFIQSQLSTKGTKGLEITTKELPQSIRSLGLKAVPGLDYTTGKLVDKTPSAAALAAMRDNVETLLGMGGNTRFYFDKNGILKAMAPELDTMHSSLMSAPFSMGSNPVDELHRFGLFLEDPTKYIPAGVTGGTAQGKALTIMMRDNPTIYDLTVSGKPEDVVKIGSYAENSGDPWNSLRATIDTHAFKLPSGLPHGGSSGSLSPAEYRLFEKIYQDVAATHGMMPHEVQSATWDIWRQLMQRDPGAMLSPENFGAVNLNPIFGLGVDARTKALKQMLEERTPGLLKKLY